jgi:hypothetical protein
MICSRWDGNKNHLHNKSAEIRKIDSRKKAQKTNKGNQPTLALAWEKHSSQKNAIDSRFLCLFAAIPVLP